MVMRGPRRSTVWARQFGVPATIASGVVAAYALMSQLETGLGAQVRNSTVVRIIGEFWFWTTAAVVGPKQLTLGIISVTQAAFDAGTAALPAADINFTADWMFHCMKLTDEETVDQEHLHHFQIDLGTGRKMPEVDRVVALIVKNATGVEIKFGYCTRLLVKLL